ncbi:MAG: hypothetical protein ABJE95_03995 [Byssovorax sp.]
MSLSLPALAQTCPPGAWFCEQAEVQTPPAPAQAPTQRQAQPPPQLNQDDEDDAVQVAPPPAVRSAPPVVVYQPVPAAPTTRVIIIAPGYGGGYYAPAPPHPRVVRMTPPPPAPPPPPPRWHRDTKWGLNLRVEGMTFGHNEKAAQDSGMGGLGLSLRYRPIPHFAFDVGIDVLGGTDFNGFKRTETPFTVSGMIFLNPRSPVQLYLLGGMHFSHAKVTSDFASPLLSATGDGNFGAEYTYFGGQGGGGLEFRVGRHVALNIDVVGFMRKRTDDGRIPEYSDPEKGSTNSSGGALLRGGLTFWW